MSLTAIIFLLAFVAGCALALFRHPVYGLLTYVGEFYVHPPSRWWGQGLLFDVRWSLLAAGVTLLALMLYKRRYPSGILRSGAFWGYAVMVGWIAIQSLWALDPPSQFQLLTMYAKFLVLIYMICACLEEESHVRWFMWAHVLGCFYLGWLATMSYTGGRLDGVGGPGIDEANAAALQMITGIVVAGALLLWSNWRGRVALLLMIPFMVNGLVTTVSRSGFLAICGAGIVYNVLAPRRSRRMVRVLSVLAVVLFGVLTNQHYWDRMSTIKYEGKEVQGVDTGGGRLEIMAAQWRMFERYPFGCGHSCTAVLSPEYIPQQFLTSGGERASHNTFMTMLVDQGVVGALLYFGLLAWVVRKLVEIRRRPSSETTFMAAALPAIAAVLAAIFIADMFVQYPKFEARVWFVSLLIVSWRLSDRVGALAEPPRRGGASVGGAAAA